MKKLAILKRFAAMLMISSLTVVALGACSSGDSGGAASTGGAEASQAAQEASTAAEAPAETTTEAPADAAPSTLDGDPVKIGVATIHSGETWEIQRQYFEEELAPLFNMEFMFSETLSDANGLVDFMDQAYAAGCEGIINFVTASDASSQGARKAEEWGMWFVTQNSALNADIEDLQYNLGHCGASAPGIGDAYSKAFEDLLSDGEPHGVIIFSCAAVGGKIGQGAASHAYAVEGILQAYQDAYGLTYDMSIDDIINRQDPGEVNTGNDDVHIYIYPGMDAQAAITAVQTQLQTGNYDTFAAVAWYSQFTNAIDEIEKSTGNNIRIIGTASIEQQTETGFNSTDSTGDTVLNAAVINPLNNANAMNTLAIFNALNGKPDSFKRGGKAQLFGVNPWACMDASTYEGIGKLDMNHATYVLNSDDLAPYMVTNNPDVTADDIDQLLTDLADIDSIISNKIQ
ncbi:MAG: hypothetical protein IK016_08885 [Lachnospiraceae bacterium]|nr:hypothetical protein [Lachnospiraceae bacterium]